MSKLIDMFNGEMLEKKQLPLTVNKNMQMILQLKSIGLACDQPTVKSKSFQEFQESLQILNPAELCQALTVSEHDFNHMLNEAIPCVACRNATNQLYSTLFENHYCTFDPILIDNDNNIVLSTEKQLSPQFLYQFFDGQKERLDNLVSNQLKRSKNRNRCLWHSKQAPKCIPDVCWREVWSSMHLKCKRMVCIVDSCEFRPTLDGYLQQHKFCNECRTKVQKATSLLMEDPEPGNEKGYVPHLYAGIKRCFKDKHIHVPAQTAILEKLISRTEPESRRERHAKTLEIAQEEVLTCIGSFMQDRLELIYLAQKHLELTCQVFVAVAVAALYRNFATTIENKRGVSQLEILCQQLNEEERKKEERKEQKKLKRKRKKENHKMEQQVKDTCPDVEYTDKLCNCGDSTNFTADSQQINDTANGEDFTLGRQQCRICGGFLSSTPRSKYAGGAGSGKESDEREFDDEALSDCAGSAKSFSLDTNNVMIIHELDSVMPSADSGLSAGESISSTPDGSERQFVVECYQFEPPEGAPGCPNFYEDENSLERMLQDPFYAGDSNSFITEEEMNDFVRNREYIEQCRQHLRENLRMRFASLCALYGTRVIFTN